MNEIRTREIFETCLSFSVAVLLGGLSLHLFRPELGLFQSGIHFLVAGVSLLAAVTIVLWTGAEDTGVEARESAALQGVSVPDSPQATVDSLVTPPLSDTAQASVAVLPLENLSEREDDSFLSQGFSAEIIRALYGVPDLRVASYQQSLSYSHLDIERITSDLDVRYVLTGSLQKVGNRLRIIVMLTDVHQKSQLWSESYVRELDDIFEVQSEIAEAIAAQVGSQYLNMVVADASRAHAHNLSSWGMVHRAMNFWITSYTKEASLETVQMLQRAIEMEPDYAMAHAELAFIRTQRCLNVFCEDPVAEAEMALKSINTAYALAPRDPTVMERTGLVWFNSGLKSRSIRLLREVVKIAPFDLVAWGYLANSLCMGGDDKGVAEAKTILQRLLSIAPGHPSVPFWHYFSSVALTQSGEWHEAEIAAQTAVDIHPGFCIGWFALGNALANQGDMEAAKQAEEKARSMNADFSFQLFFRYIQEHSSEWKNADMQYKGLVTAGLIMENEK
jgi:adenylate cyclase